MNDQDVAEIRERPVHDELLPASYIQRVMTGYYAQLETPAVLHGWTTKRLRGALDRDLVAKIVEALLERHKVLTTTFVDTAGGVVGVRLQSAMRIPIDYSDLTHLRESEQRTEIESLVATSIAQRFDLSRGPLLRIGLIKVSPSEHLFTIALHHSIADAWSLGILLRDFLSLYRAIAAGTPSPLPPLTYQFADHARAQIAWVNSKIGRFHHAYWQARLSGGIDPFWLPKDRSGADEDEPSDHVTQFTLPAPIVEGLRRFAKGGGATDVMVLHAAVATAISRWSGHDDVYLKIAYAGRYDRRQYEVVGCFAAAWVLRVDLSGASDMNEAQRRVRDAHVDSLPHIMFPYSVLWDELEARCAERPLLDITVNYVPSGVSEGAPVSDVPGSSTLVMEDFERGITRNFSLEEPTRMKLVVQFFETDGAILCDVWFSWRRFSRRTISRFCSDVRRALEEAAAC